MARPPQKTERFALRDKWTCFDLKRTRQPVTRHAANGEDGAMQQEEYIQDKGWEIYDTLLNYKNEQSVFRSLPFALFANGIV
jgi:hypothetical protein